MRFIYVMREEDKQKLLDYGYSLLKEDLKNNVWCFKSKEELCFDSEEAVLNQIPHIKSDILTF